jgi:hypothetical protein
MLLPPFEDVPLMTDEKLPKTALTAILATTDATTAHAEFLGFGLTKRQNVSFSFHEWTMQNRGTQE